MKKVFAVPNGADQTVTVRIDDALEIDDGITTVQWCVDDTTVRASNAATTADVTHTLPSTLSELTALPRGASEPFIRLWLSERLGIPYANAIEAAITQAAPTLASIYARHPDVKRLTAVSPRLWEALRAGSTPREIAGNYWRDDASRSDGLAFVDALRVDDGIDESRVALMTLAAAGDHRRHLVGVECPVVWLVPTIHVREVTAELSPRTARDFAAVAIRDPRARLQLSAAQAIGLRARGTNGGIAYAELLDDLLRSQFSAPRTLVDRAIAEGPVAGLPLAQVATDAQLRNLSKTANNCLANPSYPWRARVLRGEVNLITLGKGDELTAIVAVNPKTGAVLEAKGKGNAELPTALVAAVEARIAAVKGGPS